MTFVNFFTHWSEKRDVLRQLIENSNEKSELIKYQTPDPKKSKKFVEKLANLHAELVYKLQV